MSPRKYIKLASKEEYFKFYKKALKIEVLTIVIKAVCHNIKQKHYKYFYKHFPNELK